MSFLDILLLALVQGLAQLLPVSSSAHVILAEKLLGLDPTTPAMTLLPVMLHTGTMFAVIIYFWRDWRRTYFASRDDLIASGKSVALASIVTPNASSHDWSGRGQVFRNWPDKRLRNTHRLQ